MLWRIKLSWPCMTMPRRLVRPWTNSGLLGFLTVHGLPGTLSRATGATRASVLGSLTPGIDSGPTPRRLTIM